MERFKKERDALQSENDQLKEKADDFFLNLFNSPKHSSQIAKSDGCDGGLSSNPLLVNRWQAGLCTVSFTKYKLRSPLVDYTHLDG